MVTEKSLIQDSAQPPQESNDDDIVVSVEGVSKKFCRDLKKSLWYGLRDMTGEMIGGSQEGEDLRPGEFWALQDVSLQLRRGEALGLVGKNGSGKTTLLRILAGLIKPDEGQVKVKGTLAPLIALGAGFNEVLTGKENIYANMSILGLSKQEIDERFDDIVEFAEIPHAIDAPVRSYSTGMKARLGFACAIHTDPDILLVDEVLAVGDIQFRAKCARRLSELRKNNTSIILVSHNSSAIGSLCETSVYLSKGTKIISGETEKVIQKYEEDLFLDKSFKQQGTLYFPNKDPNQSSGIDIRYICFKNKKEEVIDSPITGEPINICIGCNAHEQFDNITLILTIYSFHHENEAVLHLKSNFDKALMTLKPGENELKVYFPYCGLNPGMYNMILYISKLPIHHFDGVDSYRFTVESNEDNVLISKNLYYQPRHWKVENLSN